MFLAQAPVGRHFGDRSPLKHGGDGFRYQWIFRETIDIAVDDFVADPHPCAPPAPNLLSFGRVVDRSAHDRDGNFKCDSTRCNRSANYKHISERPA
jgi:hypothetical protein